MRRGRLQRRSDSARATRSFPLGSGSGQGIALVEKALSLTRFGSYTLQAAIAAVHAGAGPGLPPRIGGKSSCFTTAWCGSSLPRWWN